MRAKFSIVMGLTGFSALFGLATGGCSTTTVAPVEPPKEIEVPEYVGLPQPAGYGVADLRALFTDPKAPPLESLQGCETPFKALLAKTKSRDEIQSGIRELVRADTVAYHWCFYSQVIALDDALKGDEYIDQKQKQVLEAYEFLTPVARAFLDEFRDSRYIRWAVKDYRRISEWVFFRKLDISPEMSLELVDVGSSTFGAGSNAAPIEGPTASVLKKYKISDGKNRELPKGLDKDQAQMIRKVQDEAMKKKSNSTKADRFPAKESGEPPVPPTAP